MPDEPQDIERRLSGIDQGRALPRDLAAELVDRLLDQSALGALAPIDLHGADSPRAVPAAVARRVNEAVLAVVPSARWRRGLRVDGRAAGVAAVLLLLIGTLAAISRAAPGGEDSALTRADVSPFDPWPSFAAPPTTTTAPAPPPRVVALSESDPAYARLEQFGSCQELLDWVKPRAEAQTDHMGLAGGWRSAGHMANSPVAVPGGGGAGAGTDGTGGGPPPQAAAAPAPDAGGRSGTNVIEPGIDEPDLVKVTDNSMLVLQGSQLHLVATQGGGAAHAATVTLDGSPWRSTGLLAHEHMAVVLSRGFAENVGEGGGEATRLQFLDVNDPAAPVEVRVDTLPGRLIDARLSDGTAHVVTSQLPGPFEFTLRHPSSHSQAEVDAATAENRRLIRESTIEHWVPAGVPCERVAHPRDAASFSAVSLWSVPIDQPGAATVTGLIAHAQALSATAGHLVVATAWSEPAGSEVRTHLHRFALEADGARYLASGSVPGFLPGLLPAVEEIRASYAMSARGNVIRVATTNASAEPGASQVTVVEDSGSGLLEIVGSVSGLGEVGERIVGVRFVGDLAFVVTFQFTDPLYVIDLSDPRNPRRRGELKTPGFSSYLHPLADGRLLGIGRDTSDDGSWGGALSIYDVSDLDAPRVAQRQVHRAFYHAQQDPHAFLLWETTRQIVLPAWSAEPSFEVFRLGSQGEIVHQGALRHPADTYQAQRAAMIDGALYTVSSAGVLVSDPETLTERAWVSWIPGG